MSLTEFRLLAASTPQETAALYGRVLDLASAEAVYGQPLDGDWFKVLTALEVAGGMGSGWAAGGEAVIEGGAGDEMGPVIGRHGSGGVAARPVAVISLTAAGVRVEPIIDRARVLLTFGIALGMGLLALARRR